eukprot:scaffold287470_cov17-Tisochrysis_lutea.AAC.1
MERIAFTLKACISKGCVCKDVIVLNGLVLGDGICAFITGDSNMGINLVEINRGMGVAQELNEYLQDVALDMLAM